MELLPGQFPAGTIVVVRRTMEEPEKNHGRTMEEPEKNHGRTREEPWKNHGRTSEETAKKHGRTMEVVTMLALTSFRYCCTLITRHENVQDSIYVVVSTLC